MILASLNIHVDTLCEFDDKADDYLIAAFNKIPHTVTGENVGARRNRAWLLLITEELNAHAIRSFDVVDVFHRLLQLRKTGRLGKRGGE